MKILITSDIHKNLRKLEKFLKKHSPFDYHLDAGDANLSSDLLKSMNIISVKGNTDFFSNLPLEITLEIDSKKILIIHGHTLKVKRTKDLLYNYAKNSNIDICIYGHTHVQQLEIINEIIFINPGSILDNKYAIYENGKIKLHQ